MNDKLSIDELVALRVKAEMKKYLPNTRKIVEGWLKLRKEIDEYVRCKMRTSGFGYQTIQNAIYNPIKFALDVKKIDEMSEEQVVMARRIFDFIKKEAESGRFKKEETSEHTTNF